MRLITASGIKVPERRRAVYDGSNQGNVIAPVMMRPLSEGWLASFKDKKAIYGKHRRPVGGRDAAADGDGDVPPAASPRPPTADGSTAGKDRSDGGGVEPVFYKVLPPTLYRCLVSSMAAKAVIDCTAGDGSAALAAIEGKKAYFGVCLTSTHQQGLTKYLVNAVLTKFLDEASPLRQPKLAALRKSLKLDVVDSKGGKQNNNNSNEDVTPDKETKPSKKEEEVERAFQRR